MVGAFGTNTLVEEIRSVIQKEAPNITRKVVKESLKNDPRYRKEIVDIIKQEMIKMEARTAQGIDAARAARNGAMVPANEVYGRVMIGGNPVTDNTTFIKNLKNKISYGVNTDNNSLLTNNGKRKIV